MARHTGVSHREAAGLCRAATVLRRFPQVESALVDGHVAPGHVEALASIIPGRLRGDELAEAIEFVREFVPTLLETAREVTVDDFERFCAHVRDRLDADGPPDRSAEPSQVWLSKTFAGRYALNGDLSADDGVVLTTILLEVMARLRAAARKARDLPETHHSRGGGSFLDPDADDGATPGRRPGSQWMADALMRLALDGAGAAKPGRIGFFLHADLDDLHADIPDSAHTEANLDVSDATLWRLLEDADVTPVFNTDGRPLCYGRTRRLAPDILRRVIAHRDRKCRFTWCDQPSVFTHAHHIRHWDDDGTTDPMNQAGKCGFHHLRCIHGDGWGISGAPPDLSITRPDGTPHLDDQRWRRLQREPTRRRPSRHHGATATRTRSALAGPSATSRRLTLHARSSGSRCAGAPPRRIAPQLNTGSSVDRAERATAVADPTT